MGVNHLVYHTHPKQRHQVKDRDRRRNNRTHTPVVVVDDVVLVVVLPTPTPAPTNTRQPHSTKIFHTLLSPLGRGFLSLAGEGGELGCAFESASPSKCATLRGTEVE